MESEEQAEPMNRILRIFAKTFAALAAAFWLFAIIADFIVALQKEQDPFLLEGLLLTLLVLINSVGALLAWWRAKTAAIVLILGGVALSIFAVLSAGHNHLLAVLVSGAPFLLAGLLIRLTPAGSGSKRPHP
jgi:hypothetical protein